MKHDSQDPMLKKALNCTIKEPTLPLIGTHHTPWLFATLTGLLGICQSTLNNMNPLTLNNTNPLMFLAPFIGYNALYIARLCLSHNKTIILTMISIFPISMIIMLFNGTCNGCFAFLYISSCIMFATGCVELHLTELRKRLDADSSLAELIFNEAMLSNCIFTALFSANSTVASACYGYYLTAVPSEQTPNSLVLNSTFLVFVVSALITIALSVSTFGYFSKVRDLKKPKTVENWELKA